MKRGFTLLELLVSISIISLLAAIIMPTVGSALESARSVRCQANLRTLGQGLTMYLDNGDGLLPFAAWPADARVDRMEPLETLADHVGAPPPVWDDEAGEAVRYDPWICPSDRLVSMQTGTSYTYGPYQFFQLLGRDFRRNATTIYRSERPALPVFYDALVFHDTTQGLYLDGSVMRGVLAGQNR